MCIARLDDLHLLQKFTIVEDDAYLTPQGMQWFRPGQTQFYLILTLFCTFGITSWTNMEGNKPDILIRMAVPGDCSQLVSVIAESFVEYESFYTPEAYTATTPSHDKIQSRLNEGPTWVALRNVTVVGTVSAVPEGEALYIRGMAVLPAARGLGIGETLLMHVERYASAHGYKRLTLSTTHFFSHAIHLYEKFGFRRSDEGPHDLFGIPTFMMAKALRQQD